jgi:hypothetical protein
MTSIAKSPVLLNPPSQYKPASEATRNSQIVEHLRRLADGVENLSQWAANTFSVAAYSGLSGNNLPITSIGAGWTVIPYDTNKFTPRGIVTDPVTNNSFLFNYDGVYQLSLYFNFNHDEQNQSRSFQARLWNLTDGIPEGLVIDVGVGRNNTATIVSLASLIEITEAETGKEYQLQIGNGDTIGTITNFNSFVDLMMVSEWKEEINF